MTKEQYRLQRKINKLQRLLRDAKDTAAYINAYCHTEASVKTSLESNTLRDAVSVVYSLALDLDMRFRQDLRLEKNYDNLNKS